MPLLVVMQVRFPLDSHRWGHKQGRKPTGFRPFCCAFCCIPLRLARNMPDACRTYSPGCSTRLPTMSFHCSRQPGFARSKDPHETSQSCRTLTSPIHYLRYLLDRLVRQDQDRNECSWRWHPHRMAAASAVRGHLVDVAIRGWCGGSIRDEQARRVLAFVAPGPHWRCRSTEQPEYFRCWRRNAAEGRVLGPTANLHHHNAPDD